MTVTQKQNIALLIVQLSVWLLMILAPAGVTYMLDPTSNRHWLFLGQTWPLLIPMFVVYMASFYALVPYLFFRGHKLWYVVATLALIALINCRFFMADVSMLPAVAKDGFYVLIGTTFFIHMIVALAAFALRNYLRSHKIQMQLEEERRKSAEAELTWLKNQLNPHFLFNSLNNISSLTQIDPDQAQDAIAQLSDLLRYALYESNKPSVPLMGEVEFMQNYISMMKLRCSSLTTVNVDFPASCPSSTSIAPLLFISFIENAFKHGVSNNVASKIEISLQVKDDALIFMCVNTNLPKGDADHSGSGIGLENTRRRLDLLYPNKYEWVQKVENDQFIIRVAINF